jgi:thiopurine S-methyltransferase
MVEDWLDRWENGRTGWHEPHGNAALKAHWREDRGRVLVPLCGKSADLAWLAGRGHEVVGVEVARKAIVAFFEEQAIACEVDRSGPLDCYRGVEVPISIYCGDYLAFIAEPFDALYDRGAFVAIESAMRDRYATHTHRLLRQDARVLLVTVEYDQAAAQGPPYSVSAADVQRFWGNLECIERRDDLVNCPPKFRDAGLAEFLEVTWRSPR